MLDSMGKVLCEEVGGDMEETDRDWERLAAPEICCSWLLLGVVGIGLILLEKHLTSTILV